MTGDLADMIAALERSRRGAEGEVDNPSAPSTRGTGNLADRPDDVQPLRATGLVLHERDTDEGIEYVLVGRGKTVATYSRTTIFREIEQRLTRYERQELEARGLKPTQLVEVFQHDRHFGWCNETPEDVAGHEVVEPVAETPIEKLAKKRAGRESKLSPEQVTELLALLDAGANYSTLARAHYREWGFRSEAAAVQSLRRHRRLRDEARIAAQEVAAA